MSLLNLQQTLANPAEEIPQTFGGFTSAAYKRNGIVFACQVARMLLFSEARFLFRRRLDGRPGELFDGPGLRRLDEPWPNGTTGDLLARAIQNVDLGGNFYAVDDGDAIRTLRPDWVTIIVGSNDPRNDSKWPIDAEVVAYLYRPGGPGGGEDPILLMPSQVAHWAPIPDPSFRFRGMSWLTPVIDEIMADGAATTHKLKYFEQGATPGLVVTLDASIMQEQWESWVNAFEDEQTGYLNAYKTLYLGGGADVKVMGANLRQADFKITQGAGETRIAAAARVPPIIVGLSEGLSAATYSNFAQARRAFADFTMRPLWRNFAGSMQTIIRPPDGAELWYDDRDVPALQEDQKDASEILATKAQTIKALVDAGFNPDGVVAAVTSGDLDRLEHSGLMSVQLLPPGQRQSANGAGSPAPAPEPTPT